MLIKFIKTFYNKQMKNGHFYLIFSLFINFQSTLFAQNIDTIPHISNQEIEVVPSQTYQFSTRATVE